MDMDILQRTLGYQFKDTGLLRVALTHPSKNGQENYQRLEFLGDRILGLAIAHSLFKTYPKEREGQLSRRFIALVRKEMLAEVAQELGLGVHINLTTANTHEDRENPSILSDVVEAIIAAIYLDGGIEPATDFVEQKFAHALQHVKDNRDPKSALQEWAQGHGLPLPEYQEVSRTGPDHNPTFEIRVSLEGKGTAMAKANAKRSAEITAAKTLLDSLKAEEK